MYIQECVMSEVSESKDFFKSSALYQEFLLEREEILKHKWLLSEEAGCDVGFEKALLDWIVKHRARWRAQRQKKGLESTTLVS